MKLNFKSTREINVGIDEMIDKIDNYLKDNNYKIVVRNSDMIAFTGYDHTNYTRSDYYKRVDEGKFEINKKSLDVTVLTFNYKVSIMYDFIFLTILFLAGLFANYGFFILYGAFLLNSLAKLYYLRTSFITNILNP